MKPITSARDAFADDDLLGHALKGETWRPHRILLMAAMGEELTEDERAIFRKFTQREREPGRVVAEFCTVGGRRTGKTVMDSAAATYLSTCCDYRDVLIRGEVGVLLVLAQDQRVATNILNYVEENITASPVLRQLLVRRTADAIELKNSIRVEVRPASFRKLRGPTYIAIICDELGFWYSDDSYQNPDVEVLAAARPGLMTTHGMVIMASSPHARKGLLWETFSKHFGPNGSPAVLVAKGTTTDFNPTISREEVEREIERDPERNTAEYLAEFRSDLEGYVRLEIVRECTTTGVLERPYQRDQHYFGFIDPAGGSGRDSMTLCIGHVGFGTTTLTIDALREARSPFSPEQTTAEFSDLLKTYNVNQIMSDKVGLGWSIEAFGHFGILVEQAAKAKTQLYTNFLPLLNSIRVELLDHQRCNAQLLALERTPTKIDHPPNGHDDLINAVAGVSDIAIGRFGTFDPTFRWVNSSEKDDDPDGARAFRLSRFRQHLAAHGIPTW